MFVSYIFTHNITAVTHLLQNRAMRAANSLEQKQLKIADCAKKVGSTCEKFPHEEKLQQLLREKEKHYAQNAQKDDTAVREHFKPLGKTPEQVVDSYIERVNKLSFQGGYGHAFAYEIPAVTDYHEEYDEYKFEPPHNWVVKPEYYELSKPSPDEQIALDYMTAVHGSDFNCSIDQKPSTQYWGN